ncbi:MAG: prefoldin subunit beta [Methanospirillaceae archaeon]|nr:prefoldin subunit beta [Methanospirillaceae archaeon]
MSEVISPKIQNQITMLQQLQQQMQTLLNQKNQYEIAAQETRRAIEELNETSDDAEVYHSIGTVMMQRPKSVVLENLTEKAENFEIRISSIEKQEKLVQEKFESLQAQVKAAMEGGSQAA